MSRWTDPFTIHQVYPNEAVEIKSSKDNQTFKVNCHCLKPYAVTFTTDKEDLTLLEPPNSYKASLGELNLQSPLFFFV